MNSYVENDNGFFVKVTLFKDDYNKYNWRVPFEEQTFKQLSRSLGKIPYIDLRGKTPDEHKQFETNRYIRTLQSQGIDDGDLVSKVWETFDKPESGRKGYLVDVYDISKKASYGGLLNTCELSAELVKDSDSQVAVADFILRIDDDEYKNQIKSGQVTITPSPSIYGMGRTIDGFVIYDPSQYLDFLHVANATIPANGPQAKMKGFCEGTQSSCKKQMANAALPISDINNTVTQDNISMSSNPQVVELTNNNANPTEPVAQTPTTGSEQPAVAENNNSSNEQILKVLEEMKNQGKDVPKELVISFEKLTNELAETKSLYTKTSERLEKLELQEQERKINERKSLLNKHINPEKHFKGDEKAFVAKVDWINKMFPVDEDLSIYLNEAFPIVVNESKGNDNPQKQGAYAGMPLFRAEELLEQQKVPVKESGTKKKKTGWGNLIPL